MDRLPSFRTKGLDRVDHALRAGGFALRVVGGAVRDSLAGHDPKDVDLATDATPEEVTLLAEEVGLKVIPTGIGHGTVTVVSEGEPFEVTTLRSDIDTDGRHATVSFVRDWTTDAGRRDFTINAMSASLDGEVYDYFGGRADLGAGVVRFVGDADRRIQEDYLRILRLFRFRARFGAGADDGGALEAAGRLGMGLTIISRERIWQEMSRLLALPSMAGQLAEMARLGIDREVGLTLSDGAVSMAEVAAAHGATSEAALGVILGDALEADRLSGEWKLSSKSWKQVRTAASCVGRKSDGRPWFQAMVADGASPEDVADALVALGRPEDATAIRGGLPRFPVSGRDLIALGMAPGPEMGETLRELKEAWKRSGYEATAEELLASAGPQPSPG